MSEIKKYEADPMQQFQQKVIDKIRDDIAQMLPEDVIQGLFEKALNQAFFEPQKIEQGSGWGAKTVEKPSWFLTALTEQAKPILEKQIKEIVDRKKPEIEEAIKKFVEEQNLMLIALSAMGVQMADLKSQIYNMANNIR